MQDSMFLQAIAYANLPQSRLVRIVANDNLVNSPCVGFTLFASTAKEL